MIYKVILTVLLVSQISHAEECSTTLADCFNTTITDLDAGDERLQKYENEVKKFLKGSKKNAKSTGLTFKNKSVFLKDASIVDIAKSNDTYAFLVSVNSGQKYVFTWSDGKSFNVDLGKACANEEPTEFRTEEVHTSKEVSNRILIVRECGAKKLFEAVTTAAQ